MDNFVIILFGFIFGMLISYAKLNRYNTISGLSVLKNLTVAKTIMLVIGVGSILLSFEMGLGWASFHVKPLYVLATAIGGVIFGIGMSILGYCPGTMPISIGQGSLDAVVGLIGGLFGGWIFSLVYPILMPLMGADLGKISLFEWMGGVFSPFYYVLVCSFGIAFIWGSFYLNKLDKQFNHIFDKKWILTGIGLAILNLILFLQMGQNKPLGASSSYPYVADIVMGSTATAYFPTTIGSGAWQVKFLLGAMIAGFLYALITRTFRLEWMHSRWIDYKGKSIKKRVGWAFVGGFLLIFGARLADGCTSGHIISGGMQFAASSYVFMIFTFIGFLATGYFFYTRPAKYRHS